MSLSKPSQSGPLLQGILPLERDRLGTDILAGVTLAALAIAGVVDAYRQVELGTVPAPSPEPV